MRNAKIIIIIFIGCFVTSIHAGEQSALRNYIIEKYPADFVVSDEQIAQLTWDIDHDKSTNDLFSLVNDPSYIEIDRALTRLYCAQLLRSGLRADYNKFVRAQIESGVKQPLSFSSFNRLSSYIKELSAADFALLIKASILPAVSLSKSAAKLLQQDLRLDIPIQDHIDFIAFALREHANIYSFLTDNAQNNATTKNLLYILFPPQTNFRHMLYTEGGVAMFKYMRTMITHGFLDRNGLNLWYAYWVINLAGFRGHINQHGSIYLTEPVMQAMDKLRELILTMLSTPNFNPLPAYLEYRAEGLGLAYLPEEEKLFLAHLGCLLRVYDAAAGVKLHRAVSRLPSRHKRAVLEHFRRGLHEASQVTTTHLPALLANALEFTNGDIEQVIARIIPIYNQLLEQHMRQNINSRLSLHTLSACHNVKRLLNSRSVTRPHFIIRADGEVILP